MLAAKKIPRKSAESIKKGDINTVSDAIKALVELFTCSPNVLTKTVSSCTQELKSRRNTVSGKVNLVDCTMVECDDVWAPQALSYTTMGVSSFLAIVVVTGNILICLAVVKDPYQKLRTPFMFFLVHLAIADLIVGSVTLPISVISHTLEAHERSSLRMKLHMSYLISCMASLLSLTGLCLDRYVSVLHPVLYKFNRNFKSCFIASCVVWLTAIGITMLYWLVGYIDVLLVYAQLALIVVFIMSLVTYRVTRSLRHLSKQTPNLPELGDDESTSKAQAANAFSRAERVITKALVLIQLLFMAFLHPGSCYDVSLKILSELWLCSAPYLAWCHVFVHCDDKCYKPIRMHAQNEIFSKVDQKNVTMQCHNRLIKEILSD